MNIVLQIIVAAFVAWNTSGSIIESDRPPYKINQEVTSPRPDLTEGIDVDKRRLDEISRIA